MRELTAALSAGQDELLTIAVAAVESRYSPQHLRALLAEGAIPNAGSKGRPRIRRADLPPPCVEFDVTRDVPSDGRVPGVNIKVNAPGAPRADEAMSISPQQHAVYRAALNVADIIDHTGRFRDPASPPVRQC